MALRLSLKKTLYVIFGLLLWVVLSCNSQDIFYKKLHKIDENSKNTTRENTLRQLESLAKKAKTSEHFLSISKRQYNLNSIEQAKTTLLSGLKRISSSDLAAFYTYLCIETEEYDKAQHYIYQLYDSPYESLATELLFKKNANTTLERLDKKFLLSSFRETGDQAFLVNAALVDVLNGQLATALQLRHEIGDSFSNYPYFWTLLAFDLGYFSVVFEELPNTLANYDMLGTQELLEIAKSHVLLASDCYYALKDVEMARSHWQLYIDRFNDDNPFPIYNLALTSETEQEKAEALYACFETYSDFYPTIAQYVRAYETWENSKNIPDKKSLSSQNIETLLQDKGLYSNAMENDFHYAKFFSYTPENLLKEKANSLDPKFELELLRWKLRHGENLASLKGEIYTLLEKYDTSIEVLDFARWFFAKTGNLQECFSLGESTKVSTDTFYNALKASYLGETKKALDSYSFLFEDANFKYASMMNYACTKFLLSEYDTAIEYYTAALDFAKDDIQKSKTHFRIGEILFELQQFSRAKNVLTYALELDKENYEARSLLNQISQ